MSYEEYMATMDKEMMELMVEDWYDPEDQELDIDYDSARYDPDIERWVMDAKDADEISYCLVAEHDGNIYINYKGRR